MPGVSRISSPSLTTASGNGIGYFDEFSPILMAIEPPAMKASNTAIPTPIVNWDPAPNGDLRRNGRSTKRQDSHEMPNTTARTTAIGISGSFHPYHPADRKSTNSGQCHKYKE
jgi:hypothetical protein